MLVNRLPTCMDHIYPSCAWTLPLSQSRTIGLEAAIPHFCIPESDHRRPSSASSIKSGKIDLPLFANRASALPYWFGSLPECSAPRATSRTALPAAESDHVLLCQPETPLSDRVRGGPHSRARGSLSAYASESVIYLPLEHLPLVSVARFLSQF